jgi:hypothetical protein
MINYYPVRNTDPGTSHDAAHRLKRRNKLQLMVLQVFQLRAKSGATNEDVYAGWPDEREDTLRPRVAELHNRGFITDYGTRMGSRGRHIRIWCITESGKRWLEVLKK